MNTCSHTFEKFCLLARRGHEPEVAPGVMPQLDHRAAARPVSNVSYCRDEKGTYEEGSEAYEEGNEAYKEGIEAYEEGNEA